MGCRSELECVLYVPKALGSISSASMYTHTQSNTDKVSFNYHHPVSALLPEKDFFPAV